MTTTSLAQLAGLSAWSAAAQTVVAATGIVATLPVAVLHWTD